MDSADGRAFITDTNLPDAWDSISAIELESVLSRYKACDAAVGAGVDVYDPYHLWTGNGAEKVYGIIHAEPDVIGDGWFP